MEIPFIGTSCTFATRTPSDRIPRMTLAAALRSEIMMPVVGCNGLDLLALRLDIGSDLEQEMSACLSEDEHQRAKCLAQARDRRRFVARRSYLRHILASRLGISPAEVELEYGPQGKPRLSHRMPMQELHFGMTQSEE